MSRIGQILCESVPLSQHDVEEILHEQKTTRQRFGDAALSLGKAKPAQVWDAWLRQIRLTTLDLDRTAFDPAAVTAVPAEVARRHGVVPLRLRGGDLVIAAAGHVSPEAVTEIRQLCGRNVIVAQAHAASVERHLSRLYPAAAVSAA